MRFACKYTQFRFIRMTMFIIIYNIFTKITHINVTFYEKPLIRITEIIKHNLSRSARIQFRIKYNNR